MVTRIHFGHLHFHCWCTWVMSVIPMKQTQVFLFSMRHTHCHSRNYPPHLFFLFTRVRGTRNCLKMPSDNKILEPAKSRSSPRRHGSKFLSHRSTSLLALLSAIPGGPECNGSLTSKAFRCNISIINVIPLELRMNDRRACGSTRSNIF